MSSGRCACLSSDNVKLGEGWTRWCVRAHTATHCNTLQHTAGLCNTLQRTATYVYAGAMSNLRGGGKMVRVHTHCNTLQHTATHCNTLQHTATHCNALQHTSTQKQRGTCCGGQDGAHAHTLQHTTEHCNTLQHIATHCNTLQHTATHCNTRLRRINVKTAVGGKIVVRAHLHYFPPSDSLHEIHLRDQSKRLLQNKPKRLFFFVKKTHLFYIPAA